MTEFEAFILGDITFLASVGKYKGEVSITFPSPDGLTADVIKLTVRVSGTAELPFAEVESRVLRRAQELAAQLGLLLERETLADLRARAGLA